MLSTGRFDIPSDCTAELSPKGYQFFTDIFETFDKVRSAYPVPLKRSADSSGPPRVQDRDGALAPHELDSLFSTSPGNPWLVGGFPETTITSEMGAVTLQGWLAQWS